MRFKPIKQLNTILEQEYFESTLSWALRVVMALNVPLIILPLWKGFSYEVIWAAFAAYLLSLIDYRGSHYKKIIIQCVESVLIFIAAMVGMYVGNSIILSVLSMFVVGICAALIRNWSDYGSSIGVAVGFFFLFGLSNPVSFDVSIQYGVYLLMGAAWAVLITLISFPLTPSNPLRRSVAKVWKANTDFLDAIIQRYASEEGLDDISITKKELDMRSAMNHSISLFERRRQKTRMKAEHYDLMIELRKTSSLFGACLNTIHEELETLNRPSFKVIKDSVLYKTLSSFAQANARIAVVIFTFRGEDLTMAKIRVKRCEIAIALFKEYCQALKLDEKEKRSLEHLIETLKAAHEYLEQSLVFVEEKLKLKKSDYLENYKLSFNNFLSGLRVQALVELAREMLNVNSQQFKYALRVAIGLSIGVFAFKFFKIDHGHWIALTMIIVIQPYYGATRKKGIEKIIGTVSGIILGGVIMLLPLPHEAFVVLLVVISFFVAYFLRNNYKIGVFFVTVMMVVMMQISQQGSWELIGWRVLSTLIGAALALITSYAFWPVWENQRFPALLRNALLQNKTYLSKVIQFLNKELPVDEPWYRHRRIAEAANNDVFASVQRMYEEPEKKQKQVDISFAKVGVNIRIAREITSIALMADEVKGLDLSKELNNYQDKISAIFDWILIQVSVEQIANPFPDFSMVKETLNVPLFNQSSQLHYIKTELEKIIFELETLCLLMNQQKEKLELI